MPDAEPSLRKLLERFADPAIQKALAGFTRALLFRFTDLAEEWLVRTVDGKSATLSRESCASPDVMVSLSSDVFAGIMEKRVNPMAAYLQRKIRIKGPMEDMLKLQKLML